MLRPYLSLSVLVLALLLVCPVGVQASGSGLGQAGEHLVASLEGRLIDLRDVARHHCHDLEFPIIRCFTTEKERNADLLEEVVVGPFGGRTSELAPGGVLGLLSVTYVMWWDHTNYGGVSFSSSGAISALSSINWDNRISSFKSTNGGRPKWWDGTGYTGTSWQWATSAWVPNVGSANDRFTSVQNVP